MRLVKIIYFPILCVKPLMSFLNTVCHFLCSTLFLPNIRMSSTWQTTPGTPSSNALIYLLKCSGALLMPKGNLLKEESPTVVINAASSLHSAASGSCHNPVFVSSLLYTIVPNNWTSVELTFVNGCIFLVIFLLERLDLHIPSHFVLVTLPPEQNDVASLTFYVAPCIDAPFELLSSEMGNFAWHERLCVWLETGIFLNIFRLVNGSGYWSEAVNSFNLLY